MPCTSGVAPTYRYTARRVKFKPLPACIPCHTSETGDTTTTQKSQRAWPAPPPIYTYTDAPNRIPSQDRRSLPRPTTQIIINYTWHKVEKTPNHKPKDAAGGFSIKKHHPARRRSGTSGASGRRCCTPAGRRNHNVRTRPTACLILHRTAVIFGHAHYHIDRLAAVPTLLCISFHVLTAKWARLHGASRSCHLFRHDYTRRNRRSRVRIRRRVIRRIPRDRHLVSH